MSEHTNDELTDEWVAADVKVVYSQVPISTQLLRDNWSHETLDRMIADELSGRPWVRTVTRRRRTPRERINQLRGLLAGWIAP